MESELVGRSGFGALAAHGLVGPVPARTGFGFVEPILLVEAELAVANVGSARVMCALEATFLIEAEVEIADVAVWLVEVRTMPVALLEPMATQLVAPALLVEQVRRAITGPVEAVADRPVVVIVGPTRVEAMLGEPRLAAIEIATSVTESRPALLVVPITKPAFATALLVEVLCRAEPPVAALPAVVNFAEPPLVAALLAVLSSAEPLVVSALAVRTATEPPATALLVEAEPPVIALLAVLRPAEPLVVSALVRTTTEPPATALLVEALRAAEPLVVAALAIRTATEPPVVAALLVEAEPPVVALLAVLNPAEPPVVALLAIRTTEPPVAAASIVEPLRPAKPSVAALRPAEPPALAARFMRAESIAAGPQLVLRSAAEPAAMLLVPTAAIVVERPLAITMGPLLARPGFEPRPTTIVELATALFVVPIVVPPAEAAAPRLAHADPAIRVVRERNIVGIARHVTAALALPPIRIVRERQVAFVATARAVVTGEAILVGGGVVRPLDLGPRSGLATARGPLAVRADRAAVVVSGRAHAFAVATALAPSNVTSRRFLGREATAAVAILRGRANAPRVKHAALVAVLVAVVGVAVHLALVRVEPAIDAPAPARSIVVVGREPIVLVLDLEGFGGRRVRLLAIGAPALAWARDHVLWSWLTSHLALLFRP